MRKEMIEHVGTSLDIKRKCELLNIARSSMYYQPKPLEDNSAILMNEIREIYQETPCYGYRKITVGLREKGFIVNHKKVQNLLSVTGIKAIYPTKKTTLRNSEHKVFPYLLRGMIIDHPNQVWQVDITYIKMDHGFVYLVAFIDVFSRKVMGWTLSPFLDTASCLEALNNALKQGVPEIINSDQGCQFTSAAWVETLTQKGIFISMDGKGRWADNVFVERLWRTIKYENVFLHSFETIAQARLALSKFMLFYNGKRFHQTLNYHTPDVVYALKKIPTKQELFEGFYLKNNAVNLEATMTPK